MKFTNIEIQDMWSFRKDHPGNIQLGKVTVIIGKNNSGKSNILSSINLLKIRPKRNNILISNHDIYDYGAQNNSPNPKITYSYALTNEEIESCNRTFDKFVNDQKKLKDIKRHISQRIYIILSKIPEQNALKTELKIPELVEECKRLDIPFPKNDINGILDELLVQTTNTISNKVAFIDGWRSLTSKNIENLKIMKAPSANDFVLIKRFNKIQAFFRNLTLLTKADLIPAAKEQMLNIANRDRYLPITSFGDGVVHALLMGIELMQRRDHIFLIEEPETHMHPEMIRYLMDEIKQDENNNQYIITTHSPVLLDTQCADTIIRVEYNGDYSIVHNCETDKDLYSVLDDLGARPSDILQANVVIWVEGPTDRMFLNRCFELIAPDLKEGLHYQISYYGGKLLSHLTVDPEEDQLVNILKLCRNVSLICDRDTDSTEAEILPYKKRIKEEIEKIEGVFWITKGREIENYIPDEALTEAYRKLFKDETIEISLDLDSKIDEVLCDKFPNPDHGDKWKVNYANNKTRIMPYFIKYLRKENLKQELLESFNALVIFIKERNNILG